MMGWERFVWPWEMSQGQMVDMKKGQCKANNLAYWKVACFSKPLNYKETLYPLEYIRKVNFCLWNWIYKSH